MKNPWHVALALALAALCFLGFDLRGRIAQGGPAGRVATYTEFLDPQTADFASSAYDVGGARHLVMSLKILDAEGSGRSLNCTIESSTDRANWFTTERAFDQWLLAGHEQTISISRGYKDEEADVEGRFHRNVRANCVVAGTSPSFTVAFFTTGSP